MTEIIVKRLKGAEHRDWMTSRYGFPRAFISGELFMPSLHDVISNIVGLWPLIVVYLTETGRRTDGDNLVVYYILHFYSSCSFFQMLIPLFCFTRRESMTTSLLSRWQGANFAGLT